MSGEHSSDISTATAIFGEVIDDFLPANSDKPETVGTYKPFVCDFQKQIETNPLEGCKALVRSYLESITHVQPEFDIRAESGLWDRPDDPNFDGPTPTGLSAEDWATYKQRFAERAEEVKKEGRTLLGISYFRHGEVASNVVIDSWPELYDTRPRMHQYVKGPTNPALTENGEAAVRDLRSKLETECKNGMPQADPGAVYVAAMRRTVQTHDMLFSGLADNQDTQPYLTHLIREYQHHNPCDSHGGLSRDAATALDIELDPALQDQDTTSMSTAARTALAHLLENTGLLSESLLLSEDQTSALRETVEKYGSSLGDITRLPTAAFLRETQEEVDPRMNAFNNLAFSRAEEMGHTRLSMVAHNQIMHDARSKARDASEANTKKIEPGGCLFVDVSVKRRNPSEMSVSESSENFRAATAVLEVLESLDDKVSKEDIMQDPDKSQIEASVIEQASMEEEAVDLYCTL